LLVVPFYWEVPITEALWLWCWPFGRLLALVSYYLADYYGTGLIDCYGIGLVISPWVMVVACQSFGFPKPILGLRMGILYENENEK